MHFDLEPYDHVLLDMNGTFLFEFDRFGPEQDFGKTYQQLGFKQLGAEVAHQHVRAAYDYMAVRYVDEAYYDKFPKVEEAVHATKIELLSDEVIDELVRTFTAHELGVLPKGHKEALHTLAELKPISILSNLWAPKQAWLEKFEHWGIHKLFTVAHFSSDGYHMKPHPTFFEKALNDIYRHQPNARILYVGDSFRCDIMGALGSGIDSIWLSEGKQAQKVQGQPVEIFDNLVNFVAACSQKQLS